MFHISGGHNDKEKDEHLNLWEGNIDLKFIKECIQNSENKLVTFETPKENISSLNGDIKNINYFKEIC
ncbi:MAG: hypothetical protein KJ771_04260 [Nanoarchaeota archaeon]|nr:hypothetical protein [Nanoarchaeota archaeon]